MAIQRERIYSALFDLLTPMGPEGVGPQIFQFVSRRVVPVSKLTPQMQPALFMVESGEEWRQEHLRMPPVVLLYADLYCLQRFDSRSTTAPSIVINGLMDQLDDALNPLPGIGAQILGGLVQRAWVEGSITEYFPSTDSMQSMTVLRISIMTNH